MLEEVRVESCTCLRRSSLAISITNLGDGENLVCIRHVTYLIRLVSSVFKRVY